MCSCQMLAGFLSVLRFLLFTRNEAMQPLELLLSFAIMTRIVYRISRGIGIVGFQSYIDTNLFLRWLVYGSTLCLDCELHIVAISTVHNPDPLDLLGRKCCNLLLRIAYQSQTSNTTPIGEGNVLPIRRELPARLLVLHAPVIVLKPGIAFLAGLVVLAVLIEAGNSK